MTIIKYMLSLCVHHLIEVFSSEQSILIVTPILALLALKIVWDLIIVLQLIVMFKTSNKPQVLWLKVVSRGSNQTLGSF